MGLARPILEHLPVVEFSTLWISFIMRAISHCSCSSSLSRALYFAIITFDISSAIRLIAAPPFPLFSSYNLALAADLPPVRKQRTAEPAAPPARGVWTLDGLSQCLGASFSALLPASSRARDVFPQPSSSAPPRATSSLRCSTAGVSHPRLPLPAAAQPSLRASPRLLVLAALWAGFGPRQQAGLSAREKVLEGRRPDFWWGRAWPDRLNIGRSWAEAASWPAAGPVLAEVPSLPGGLGRCCRRRGVLWRGAQTQAPWQERRWRAWVAGLAGQRGRRQEQWEEVAEQGR